MSELQLEGADVYMSTFAALKSYPFFREVQNWFYPFSKQHSSVLKALKKTGNKGNTVLDLILEAGIFQQQRQIFVVFHHPPITPSAAGDDAQPAQRAANERIDGEFKFKSLK